jgi:hypothetical protein
MDKTPEPNPLPRLYSPEDVRAMFPENRRPSVRTVIQKAKVASWLLPLDASRPLYG